VFKTNRSIVQGSGIGSYPYMSMESDLHILYVKEMLLKFADDTNLLLPEDFDVL
jgi:hypothetical protein